MRPIPVLVGPTASGKTEIAVGVAEETGAIIVNADSRKLYRHLDVGTAKPPPERRHLYRLLDILEPCESFSAHAWARRAEREIEGALAGGRPVFLEGASVLYLRALFVGFFPQPDIPDDVRLKARELAASGEGYAILLREDPETARKLHPHDVYRISRALEVLMATGKPISWWRRQREKPRFEGVFVYIDVPREELYRRIEERARRMFLKEGLVEETRRIMEMYPCFAEWGKKVIAYRQAIEYIEGKYDLETAIRKKAKADKVLARRQRRFIRSLEPLVVVSRGEAARTLKKYLKEQL
ncbi:MAG: tRNA (adenosine(37)-N6)-dimethylallyltransferase MiaA [Thermotogae bacterium]|nr:tRNA (adenosine(37)-N6)-dimethylallyltransferase MiaA [Thermotogota bacterium]